MHEDVRWFIGIIVIFGIIWFATGGLNSSGSRNPFITPLNVTGGGQTYGGNGERDGVLYYGSDSSSASPKTLTAKEEIAQSLENAGLKATQIKKELEALELAKRTSPFAGKLRIGNISRGGTNEYVLIQAAPDNTSKILVTGMRLQSEASGNGVSIPKAAALPLQNSINKEEPLYLAPGETAYIITGRSPLGISFRTNKCTGYFNQYQSFNPGIPSRCPAPQSEPLPAISRQFNDQCFDYLATLPSCRAITSPPSNLEPECRQYVTTEFNYTKCVDNHRNDKDFYDPTWYVYLARSDALWKSRRELIHLLDANGKIIDVITY